MYNFKNTLKLSTFFQQGEAPIWPKTFLKNIIFKVTLFSLCLFLISQCLLSFDKCIIIPKKFYHLNHILWMVNGYGMWYSSLWHQQHHHRCILINCKWVCTKSSVECNPISHGANSSFSQLGSLHIISQE